MTERDARKTRYENLNKDGLRIINNMVEAKLIVETSIKDLEDDWTNLDLVLKRFQGDLEHTKDSESLKDDLVNLDKWIDLNSEGLDEIEGSTLAEIEEMLRRQEDFEKSIAVQEGRFQSTLGRLSKYAENVQSKVEKQEEERINPDEKKQDSAYRNNGIKSGTDSFEGTAERSSIPLEDHGRQTETADNRLEKATSVNEGNKLYHSRAGTDELALKNNKESVESAWKQKKGLARTYSSESRAKDPYEDIFGTVGSMDIGDVKHYEIERDSSPVAVTEDDPNHSSLYATQSLVRSNDDMKSSLFKLVGKSEGHQSIKEIKDAVKSIPSSSIKMADCPQKPDEQHFVIPQREERDRRTIQTSGPEVALDMSIPTKVTDTERAPSIVKDNYDEEDVSQPNFEDDITDHDQNFENISDLNADKDDVLNKHPFGDSCSKGKIEIPDLAGAVPGTDKEFMGITKEPEFMEPIEEPILIPETHDIIVESMPDMAEMFGYPEPNKENFPALEGSADFEFFDSEDDDEIEFNFDVPKENSVTTRDPFESRISVEEFDRRMSLPRDDERLNDAKVSGDDFELFIEDPDEVKTPRDFKGEKEDGDDVVSGNLSGIQIKISAEDVNDILTNDDVTKREDHSLGHGTSNYEIKNPNSSITEEVTDDLKEDSLSFKDSLASNKTLKKSNKMGSKDIISFKEIESNMNMPENIVTEPSSNKHDEGTRESPVQHSPREYVVKTSDIGDLSKNSQAIISVIQPAEFEDDTMGLTEAFPQGDYGSKDVSLKFAGDLKIREEFGVGGKRSPNRKWQSFYSVIIESSLVFFQSKDYFKRERNPEKEFSLDGAMIHVEPTNNSLKNILRLRLSDRSECLIMSEDEEIVNDFLMAVTECTGMMGQEDSVSLPPAPPPPSLPKDIVMKSEIKSVAAASDVAKYEVAGKSLEMKASGRSVPEPELSSDGRSSAIFTTLWPQIKLLCYEN